MLGLIPRVPEKNFRGKIIDVAEVNQQHWIEESGQWLENVDRTHLVLSSGKPVQQKKDFFRMRCSQSMQSSCAPALLSVHTVKWLVTFMVGDFSDRFVP